MQLWIHCGSSSACCFYFFLLFSAVNKLIKQINKHVSVGLLTGGLHKTLFQVKKQTNWRITWERVELIRRSSMDRSSIIRPAGHRVYNPAHKLWIILTRMHFIIHVPAFRCACVLQCELGFLENTRLLSATRPGKRKATKKPTCF